MTKRFSDESLSAYFDGETSPEERVEVERVLENSSEARRQLQEIEQLSHWLRSLPQETAPEELPAAVRMQAERESLLASAPDRILSTTRRRMALWSGTAIAATLIVAVWGFNRFGGTNVPPSTGTRNVAASEDTRTEIIPALTTVEDTETTVLFSSDDREKDTPPADSAVAASTVDTAARSESGETTPDAPTLVADQSRSSDAPEHDEQDGSASASPMTIASETVPQNDSAAAAPMANAASEGQFPEDVAVDQLKPGDIVRYLKTSGDDVTVFEVTVIDVQQALGAMQVLLAKNAIINEHDNTESTDADAQLPRQSSDRLFAVYVETTGSQLASTLGDMTHRDLFLKIKYCQSVALDKMQLAQNDHLSRQRFARLQRQSEWRASRDTHSTSIHRTPSRNAVNTLRTFSQGAGPSRASDAVTMAESAVGDSNRAPAESSEDNQRGNSESYQLLVTLPRNALQTRPDDSKEKSTDTSSTDSSPTAEPKTKQPGSQADPESDNSHKPVRIVFVLKEKPQYAPGT